MINKIFYFIISSLFLFFSSNINPKLDSDSFYDKNQAIYMISSSDNTESYGFIQLNKIEVFSNNIIRTGTPNNFVEVKPIVERFSTFEEYKPIIYKRGYYTILIRYKSRILRI